jgi:hypothetical protein
MSTIKVDKIEKRTGSTLTLGGPGTAVTLACGATQTGFGRTGTVDWCTTAKTAPFTSVSGKGYFVNTTGGAVTVTLPSSPSAGDIVSVKDYASTFSSNNLTIGRGGSKIGSECLDATLNTDGDSITLVYVDGTQGWLNIQTDDTVVGQSFVAATGGTITTCGDFKIHTFTASGCFAVSNAGTSSGSNTVDYLVVAGGGAGAVGEWGGGGGGAGGYRESSGAASGSYSASPLGACVSASPVSVQTYPITVGAGGAGGTANPYATNGDGDSGSNSVFSTITSAGGGGAGGGNQAPGPVGSGKAGGSGGGGSGPGGGPQSGANFGAGNTPPVSPPQGNPGGHSSSKNGSGEGGGAGGGAGAAGNDSPGTGFGGDGGNGVASSITGSPVSRGGGGGASGDPAPSYPGSAGSGGTGGGASAVDPYPGTGAAGTVNTGGGGAGQNSSGASSPSVGGAGGSGIVIIRYKFQ